ncbi:hypothetical protein EDB86DRAFT_3242563 [Lactarius hatsudake]|nr:hypothetical protein EDB86DRAFT_3242563 [Lactarius hatsudake]
MPHKLAWPPLAMLALKNSGSLPARVLDGVASFRVSRLSIESSITRNRSIAEGLGIGHASPHPHTTFSFPARHEFLPWSAWLDPDEMDSALWLDFFCNLKSVTRLEVAGMFVPSIELALEQLPEETVRSVLPALHDLHFGKCQTYGPFDKFADACQLFDRPLTVHYAAPFLPPNAHPNESADTLSMTFVGVVG